MSRSIYSYTWSVIYEWFCMQWVRFVVLRMFLNNLVCANEKRSDFVVYM